MSHSGAALADIQNQSAAIPIGINMVGVRGLYSELRLKDRACGMQTTRARVDLGVNLPANRKGTHMSRLVQTLDEWDDALGCKSTRKLLENLRRNLQATIAWAKFHFPYMIRKKSPASGHSAPMTYDCSVSARLEGENLLFTLGVKVPVMTVCPCSLAISSMGAHSQRAIASIHVCISHFVWLEEFIELAEASGSSPVYPLLKREDEKAVTEAAFSNPAFVEDAARRIAAGLAQNPHARAFKVDVQSMESIHNHDAFAIVESEKWRILKS